MSQAEGRLGAVIIFMPFEPALDRTGFACGRPELDKWLREYAGQQERAGSARTTFAVDEKEACIAGFFSLVTYQLEPSEAAGAMAGKRKYPIPAMLLARLAVDVDYQGRGIGRIVLFTALEYLVKTSHAIGFEIVVVDALDESAACFYLKHGFRRFADHGLKLFMTTQDLRATFINPR